MNLAHIAQNTLAYSENISSFNIIKLYYNL
jgi:hypothetical protein